MIRILLACAGGMSTSLLMNKMKEEADKRGIEVSVDAVGEKTIGDHVGKFDVLLLGPQVSFIKDDVKKLVGDSIPVEIIPSIDYGRCNGEAVVKFAEKLLEKEKKNECAR